MMLAFDVYSGAGEFLSTHSLGPGEYSVGRGWTADVRVGDPSLARKHALIEVTAYGARIVPWQSRTLVRLNGNDITDFGSLEGGDQVSLGEVSIEIVVGSVAGGKEKSGERSPTRVAQSVRDSRADETDSEAVATPMERRNPGADVATEVEQEDPAERATDAPAKAQLPVILPLDDQVSAAELVEAKRQLQNALVESLDLYRRNIIDELDSSQLREQAHDAIRKIIDRDQVQLPEGIDREKLREDLVAEAIGYGPLEPLLDDPSITEIMVNGASQIFAERNGALEKLPACFVDEYSLMRIIERIVTSLGRRIDEGSPMVDARLPDGSRVNAIIPPLSLVGATLTIRKFNHVKLSLSDMTDFGSCSRAMEEFLAECVRFRKNIVVSGGTGSGKTTLLNALSQFIGSRERIVTIEDAAELKLPQDHVVSLESRPPNVEGEGAVTIRDLVRNSLRMRPDRIIVGECRGGEALDMLQAMNTGHDGSLTTGHANSPRDLLSRLEVMSLMAGMDLPVRAIREQVASAVDIIIQQSRFSDGKRRITSIVEVAGMEGDVILMQKLFEFNQRGLDRDGRILGEHQPTGQIPGFYEELEAAGIEVNRERFGLPESEYHDSM